MIKRTIIVFFVCVAFLNHCFAIGVSAKSAILYEPETKTVLFEKDSEAKRAIASTTKIMTAVVVLENANLSDVITIPEMCVGTEGTSMYLKADEKLSVEDLLYGLMLQSGNDAALALAYYVGNGDVAHFVDMMNAKAAQIGMVNTNFENPNGLPAEKHVSTAKDMAVLAAYAMENPDFANIVSTKSANVAGRTMANHNKLLRLYDGVNGIKTGFTKAAGRCLVSSAEKNGMKLVAVTLFAPDDWNDHIRMFDFGFNNFSKIETPAKGEFLAKVDVVGGTKTSVSAVLSEKKFFLEKTENADRICREIFLPRFIYAPITRGDVIGELRYTLDGRLVGKSNIIADVSVDYYETPTFWDRILKLLRRK